MFSFFNSIDCLGVMTHVTVLNVLQKLKVLVAYTHSYYGNSLHIRLTGNYIRRYINKKKQKIFSSRASRARMNYPSGLSPRCALDLAPLLPGGLVPVTDVTSRGKKTRLKVPYCGKIDVLSCLVHIFRSPVFLPLPKRCFQATRTFVVVCRLYFATAHPPTKPLFRLHCFRDVTKTLVH